MAGAFLQLACGPMAQGLGRCGLCRSSSSFSQSMEFVLIHNPEPTQGTPGPLTARTSSSVCSVCLLSPPFLAVALPFLWPRPHLAESQTPTLPHPVALTQTKLTSTPSQEAGGGL